MTRRTVSTAAGGILIASVLAAIVTMAPVNAERPSMGDPTGTLSVDLEIEGVVVGRFGTVEGLSIEREVLEHQVVNAPTVKTPGRLKYGNITLKRGYLRGDFMSDWVRATLTPDGEFARKNGALIVVDRRNQAVARWNFYNAWPAKWTGPEPPPAGNEIAVEGIVLVVERIDF